MSFLSTLILFIATNCALKCINKLVHAERNGFKKFEKFMESKNIEEGRLKQVFYINKTHYQTRWVLLLAASIYPLAHYCWGETWSFIICSFILVFYQWFKLMKIEDISILSFVSNLAATMIFSFMGQFSLLPYIAVALTVGLFFRLKNFIDMKTNKF